MTKNERRSENKRFRSLTEFDKEYFASGTEPLPRSFDNSLRITATFVRQTPKKTTDAERRWTAEATRYDENT